ncbi:TetR/AcrR family transcriptional regulator [Pannonibacter sp. Pt2-lr]
MFCAQGHSGHHHARDFAEAGLSAGAVYNYYRTKDDLIADGITASTAESAEAITAAAEVLSFDEVIGQFLADLKAAASDGRARATPMIHAEVAVRPDLLKVFQEGRSRIRDACAISWRAQGRICHRRRPERSPVSSSPSIRASCRKPPSAACRISRPCTASSGWC